jgi:S-DNA-T family DNA segregation ATPase FtsK/SpoIIIE
VKVQRWTGLLLIAGGLFLLAAILTFDPPAYRRAWESGRVWFPAAERLLDFTEDAGVSRGPLAALVANLGGGIGLGSAALAVHLFGWIAVWSVPVGALTWGRNRLFLEPPRAVALRTAAAVPLLLAVTGLAGALATLPWAGAVGEGVWSAVRSGIGAVGGGLLLLAAGTGFFFLEAEAWDGRKGAFTRAAARHALRALRAFVAGARWALQAGAGIAGALLRLAFRSARASVRWLGRRPWEQGATIGKVEEAEEPATVARAGMDALPTIVHADARDRMARAAPLPPSVRPASAAPVTAAQASTPGASSPTPSVPPPAPGIAPVPGALAKDLAHDLHPPKDVEAAVLEARRRLAAGRRPAIRSASVPGTMVPPGVDLLDDVPDVGPPVPEDELRENSRILTQTLLDFGIAGRVGEIHPGPVITRYEYIPGPGVRVAQILNRQDDLALKLRASRIRILAPIPGKAAVGIEVPNRNPAPIFLRRLLETRTFHDASGPLPLALGKDIGGAPVITELSRMPHLLIAGTTGSGKSVCMNALITSLLLKRTPEELRLLMIDPKMLELPMYNGIPHLLSDVVTDPRMAVRVFRWALLEMERRYRVLAARGCRNLASYNLKVEKDGPGADGEGKLPYMVILIDELADLMITSGREVEEPIARLAQTARAVGIHLVVATQRPSVDVITGVIKANFPARIAFQVASRTDSRTILDQNGAESLLGKGDMLFLPPGQAAPLRVHGAYVSEEETQRLAQAWREQGEPTAYAGLDDVLAEPEAPAGGLGEDPLFEDAARLVVQAGQASASLLQRRLKVGYARAARLVDMLEMAGVVAAADGSKPREILVDEVRLEHVLSGQEA